MALIENLIDGGWLKTKRIIQAFRKIERKNFLPEKMKDMAELNEALLIGFGQTISQPLVVAFMLELLQPQEGEKILDIGSGSGWTTALLGYLVGKKGKVIGIDIVPELVDIGKKNISRYNFIKEGRVEVLYANGWKGLKKEAPFDKILCSASSRELPFTWIEQLKDGGKIVAPLNNSIWLFEKVSPNQINKQEYPGFMFVPLVKKY
jgi:protein-L-isoaspartate(D-aspartate) O-methyltransferase